MKFICKIEPIRNVAFVTASVFSARASAQEMPNDYQNVLKSLDRKGDFKGGVLKVNIPHNDLKMTIQGFATPTPFGSFGCSEMHKQPRSFIQPLGDLVLLQEEVNP